MDKLTAIKIKHPNGQYSDPILLSVLADNVRYDDTRGLKDVVQYLDTRIGNIIAAPSGSTDLDIQVIDARTGADTNTNGQVITHASAGDAIRSQYLKSLNSVLVRTEQPSEAENKLWIDKSTFGDDEVQILTIDDLDIIAPIYSENSTYAAGDYVVYDGGLYRCNADIETAEPWDSTHWTSTNVGNEVTDLKSAITNVENMSPITFFDQTVSGTQMQDVSGLLIPAGTYDITVESIISSDTDAEVCAVRFISNGTVNKVVNFARGNNISRDIVFTADIDMISFYASSSWSNGSNDTFVFTGFKLSQDMALVVKINSIDSDIEAVHSDIEAVHSDIEAVHSDMLTGFNDGILTVDKTIVWQDGYINSSGKIMASTKSAFALVKMYSGETIEIGTANSNITIIGSTAAENVSVGDTVIVIQTTKSSSFEKYIYTATNDINLVVSVKRADYSLSFHKNTTIIDSIVDGWINGRVVTNGAFYSDGRLFTNNTNRIRTDFIQFRAYDKITIVNGSFQHAVGIWNGIPAIATNKRNDETFNSADETIIPDYDGYMVIVFRRPDNSNISVNDFDGKILLYQSIGYRAFVAANNSGAYNLPQYYFANDYLKNKTDRINALGKTGDDVFCFITDIHWERNARHSPDLIRYIAQKCSLFKAFNGGDVADASLLNTYKQYRSAMGTIYHVAGNHDYFSPTTGRDLYYCMDSANNNQIGSPFEHYWYVDNVQLKIRYIVLNSFTRADGSTTITAGYDETQRIWFRDVALNLPGTDWDVIVFTHILRTTTPAVSGASDIETIIDTFNADTSHTGKILCVFQGHTHWDAIYHTPSGVPVITTTCDKWDLSNETSTIPTEGIAWREKDTIKEQAFDIVILNREARKFTCVRIGAPAQNNIDKYRTDTGFTWIGTLEEREITY